MDTMAIRTINNAIDMPITGNLDSPLGLLFEMNIDLQPFGVVCIPNGVFSQSSFSSMTPSLSLSIKSSQPSIYFDKYRSKDELTTRYANTTLERHSPSNVKQEKGDPNKI